MEIKTEDVEAAILIAILAVAIRYYTVHYKKAVRHVSGARGELMVLHMISQNHDDRVSTAFRMPVHILLDLTTWLQQNGGLKDGLRISARQKVGIFLMICGHGMSQRLAAEFFQHSLSTISRYVPAVQVLSGDANNVSSCFNEVLNSLQPLHIAYVKQPTIHEPLSRRILFDPRFSAYFGDCVGALDGTHIDAYISGESPAPFRNRKGGLSQNVLAVCNFELQFTYVLAGWEGSVHDSRVLRDAICKGEFIPPEGKYYLGDAGYSNTKYLLAPYRKVRYHLKEQYLSESKYLISFNHNKNLH
jgi:hypothetical protein